MYVAAPDTRRRVFVLGPSHHAYLEGCALTPFHALDTPLGALSVDMQGGYFVADLNSEPCTGPISTVSNHVA